MNGVSFCWRVSLFGEGGSLRTVNLCGICDTLGEFCRASLKFKNTCFIQEV